MGNFFPLLEGFLAYALTILALCFAVSSVVSVIQRTRRWRAIVMRDMMEYLFRNDLLPLYADICGKKLPNSAEWDELRGELGGLKTFLVDMTMLPVPRREPKSADQEASELDPRLDAIRDPNDTTAAKGSPSEQDAARNTLDSLTEDEFKTRLLSSVSGKTLIAKAGAGSSAAIQRLVESFNVHCRAATELFQRRSRRWSVAIGFILVFAANVDSFSLLNRYLSDPTLTAKIVAENLNLPATGALPAAAAGATAASLDGNIKTVTETIDKINQFPAMQAQLKEAADALNKAKKAAEDTQAIAKASATAVAAINNGFPIGWTLYPACTEFSASPRCAQLARVTLNQQPDDKVPGVCSWLQVFAGFFWNNGLAAQSGGCVQAVNRVIWLWDNDTAGVMQWLIGVLLTGAMVGLGAPFWIEVVNNMLRARQLVADFRAKK